MTNERIPDAPGSRGPSGSGWYDEPEAVPAGDTCETTGCSNPALPNQCGCLAHGACVACERGVEEVGPLVVASDGAPVCITCTTLRAVAS